MINDIIMNLITEHNYGERIPVSKNGKEDHLMEKEIGFVKDHTVVTAELRHDTSSKTYSVLVAHQWWVIKFEYID